MNPWIIGITGYARSGKDTAAEIIIKEHGFKRVSFADAIRRDLTILDPYIDNAGTKLSYAMFNSELSLEQIKADFPEWRRLMQFYGTDVWRTVNSDIWVTRVTDWINADWIENNTPGYILPDVRFHNERDLINFDFVFRVDRPDVGALNAHESEKHIADIEVDFVINNDDTIEVLHQTVLAEVERRLPINAEDNP